MFAARLWYQFADVRGPVAERAARATALTSRYDQILRVGARLGDVLGRDPDAVAVNRRCAIIAPTRTVAAEYSVRRKAVPRTSAGGGNVDFTHADLRVE